MAQNTTPAVFELHTLAVSRGKGANGTTKADLAHRQGAFLGLLIQENVNRKAVIAELVGDSFEQAALQVSQSQYGRAMATLVAISQRPFTYSTEDGVGNRADWKRLGAELKGHGGKATDKAFDLFTRLDNKAESLRAERMVKIG